MSSEDVAYAQVRGVEQQIKDLMQKRMRGEISEAEYARQHEALMKSFNKAYARSQRGETTYSERKQIRDWRYRQKIEEMKSGTKQVGEYVGLVSEYTGEVKEYTGAVRLDLHASVADREKSIRLRSEDELQLHEYREAAFSEAMRWAPRSHEWRIFQTRESAAFGTAVRDWEEKYGVPFSSTYAMSPIAAKGSALKTQAIAYKGAGQNLLAGVYASGYMATSVVEGGMRAAGGAVGMIMDPIGALAGLGYTATHLRETVGLAAMSLSDDPVRFVGNIGGGIIAGAIASDIITWGKKYYVRERYLTDLPDSTFTPYDDAVLQAIPEEVTYTELGPEFKPAPPKVKGEAVGLYSDDTGLMTKDSPFKFKDELGGFKPTHVRPGETFGKGAPGTAYKLIYKELDLADLDAAKVTTKPLTIVKSTAAEAAVTTPQITVGMKVEAAPRTAHLPGVWGDAVDIIYDQSAPSSAFYERLGTIGAALPKTYAPKDAVVPTATYTQRIPVFTYPQDPITRMDVETKRSLKDLTTQVPRTGIGQGQPIKLGEIPVFTQKPIPRPDIKPIIIPFPSIIPIPSIIPRNIQYPSLRQGQPQISKGILKQETLPSPPPPPPSLPPPNIPDFKQPRTHAHRGPKKKKGLDIGFDFKMWGEMREYPIKTPKKVLKGLRL